jgi:AraC family transcriptional regulator of adaptative response/methylated-DNA-[protein]-cysteine methyltransferase
MSTPSLRPIPTRANASVAEVLHYAIVEHALGRLLIARSPRGIRAVLFDDSDEALVDQLDAAFPHATLLADGDGLREDVARVLACIDRPDESAMPELDVGGSRFQREVWQALRAIPRGERVSYARLAARLGKPTATRAVAAACAANVLAVLIPCHRVVRADGALSGYRWGVQRKRALLTREARA